MPGNMEIARFSFEFSAEEGGNLPLYKGGVLRGGFGYTFGKLACHTGARDCRGCDSKETCPYSYIFETSPIGDETGFSHYSEVPRPFVIESDESRRRSFSPGDPLQFNLILMGKAVDYLPYFIFCFDELGRRGLGRNRIRFRLEAIRGFEFGKSRWVPLYDPESGSLSDQIPVTRADELHIETGDTLSMEFLTPARIKYRGKYITHLEFHVMIRSLMRRISMIMAYHGDGAPELDINDLIARAQTIEVQKWDLKWQDWPRYSTRQRTEMKLGGLVGKVTYEGDFEKFLPIIALGEQIHIGKNTTFGLGRYSVVHEGSIS